MNQKHRLMCESWVEKRPEISQDSVYGTTSRKQSIKWKTRYAMLVVSCETRMSEIRFYQKKPRSCTEITDDIIKLQPWQYIVDIPSWIVDKGRPHVLRLRLLPESVVPGQHFRLQIAFQSSEEATAWMRCIQNQTKLTSGVQGHSFGVVAEECSATARIGVAGKHCLLFVSPRKVILAHKTDRSVVCVWPFEAIRSYASDDDRRLVVEAGRCAPLGEGVYSFRTRENDDNVLFDLFDHYTTMPIEEIETTKKKSKGSHSQSDQSHHSSTAVLNSSESFNKSRKPALNPVRQDSSRTSSNQETTPPQKPPLPENRKTVPVTPAKEDIVRPNNTPQTTPKIVKPYKDRDSVSKGLYDLDKLLYTLEGSVHPSQENVSEIERPGYDVPVTSEVIERRKSEKLNANEQNVELAYAINTIKNDLEFNDLKGEDWQKHEAEKIVDTSKDISEKPVYVNEVKLAKPEIAPKPSTTGMTKLSSNLTKSGLPPYAKVDKGQKIST